MSDDVRKPARISRQGVVLIKSFEGFRPRAVQREDGGWVIGYGHTLSAREGLTVSEAEAELLLQYDLIPVVKAVTEATQVPLNQHQFDALASFAYSIGVERFRASDVVSHLNAGAPGRAVAAMADWDDAGAARKPTRRRSAEHALFNAAPGAPVTLADLLAAPLPSPFVEAETPTPEPPADEAAVAALLGQDVAPFPEVSDDAPAAVDAPAHPLTAANDADAASAPENQDAAETEPASPPARVRRKAKGSAVDLAVILVLGALGMLAVGAAMAAFVRATTAPGGGSTLIGWVLIALAAACIGVSGYNLYQRWGRADRL